MPKTSLSFIIVVLLCVGTSWGQGPLILTTSPLTNGVVGADYFLPLAVSGGMPPRQGVQLLSASANGIV